MIDKKKKPRNYTKPQPWEKNKFGNLPGPGPGRPKGAPNKKDVVIQDLMLTLVNEGAEKALDWLMEIGDANPAKALALWLKSCEYIMPKLARTELTGKDGGPIDVTHIRKELERKLDIIKVDYEEVDCLEQEQEQEQDYD